MKILLEYALLLLLAVIGSVLMGWLIVKLWMFVAI